ncbi:MAG: beta-glucosidase BglX [Turicibacter sp.]
MSKKMINIEELINSMTVKEKVGQLLQLAPFLFSDTNKGLITGPMDDMGLTPEIVNNAGSVLGISGAKEMKEIQQAYLEKNEKKIPLLIMADIVHGYKTIFPIPLALGCSWDTEAAEHVARISAVEASAGGVHVTFSPMVDLVRDARWGRVMESTGEDPYLNSLFARAFVRGYQNDDISKNDSVAACVKHFAAYGAAEGGRDYNTVDMSERILREYYLPSYKAAIEEGCKMLMTSFNVVDGVPPSGNTWLMRDLLRAEWGFDGTVISDWGAVKELIPHGIAADEREAAQKAIEAGVDIEMMTVCYTHHLEKLIEQGDVQLSLLDESVRRILELKVELCLFDNPFKGADEELEKEVCLSEKHRQAAREIATKSMVLLKNEDVLPLEKNINKIAIIGPYAENHSILGGWSWQGKLAETISIKEGLINKIGEDHVIVARGCGIEDGTLSDIQAAVEVAKEADVIILALGEDQAMSGEGGCRTNISLPGLQMQLAREILKLGKKTAVILVNGRPLDITELNSVAPAILEAWFPGTEGGNAIADILFGDANPTARLSMAIPYHVGQLPLYYNCFNTGRPKVSEESDERYCTHYLDAPNRPLYPFGYGLDYTTFEYSDFTLDKLELSGQEKITASITVKNTGIRPGHELVQLYIRDVTGSVVRPIKELKGFKRVALAPNEEVKVDFVITEDMLRFHNRKLEFASEKGLFHVMIGKDALDLQTLEFNLI